MSGAATHQIVLDATMLTWALAGIFFLAGVFFTLGALIIVLLLRDVRNALIALNDFVRKSWTNLAPAKKASTRKPRRDEHSFPGDV